MTLSMNFFLIGIGFFLGSLAHAQTPPIPVHEISRVQVPVLAVTEFNRTLRNQEPDCLAVADPSAPVVEGAISASQACVFTNNVVSVRVFKVVYEHLGRQYAVELPENPGPYIQLQTTVMPKQNSLAAETMPGTGTLPTATEQPLVAATALTYPYIFHSGIIYRPMPVFFGPSFRGVVGHRMGRGRKH